MTLMDFHSLPLWLPFLLLLPILSLLFLKQENKVAKRPNHPPSPPKLPIIGHLHKLGKSPHHSLSQLANKYGSVMLLQLGRVPTLVVSSAQMAKEVLKTHDLHCCSRPLQSGPKRLSYNFSDVIFVPYGNYWRGVRKLCVLQLFNAKRVQSFQFVREEEVAHMINSISQASSTSVNLTEKLFSLTNNITCRVAFGKSYQGIGFGNGKVLLEIINETMVILASFTATDFFPSLGLGWIIDVITGLHGKIEKNFHDLDDFYQRVIEEHLNPERQKPEHADIVDVLLGLEMKEFDGIRLSKDHIKGLLMNIFLGGVGTSAMTMVWAMTELALNPRVMRKVQDEVRSYVGNKGKVDESDLDQLQYFKMVIKETLRLHPPGPLLAPHEAVCHFQINGYDVYPKTRILVNVWAIGRDPKYWENPEEFLPERFMDSSIDFKGHHFEFLPFGAGRRSCPGIFMANATMELPLANLLYCFNWELPSGVKNEGINMDEIFGIVVHKKTALRLVPIKWP